MEIRRVRLSDAEVEPLLAGLTDEYDNRYGENIEMTRASPEEFDPPAGLFVVAHRRIDHRGRRGLPPPRFTDL